MAFEVITKFDTESKLSPEVEEIAQLLYEDLMEIGIESKVIICHHYKKQFLIEATMVLNENFYSISTLTNSNIELWKMPWQLQVRHLPHEGMLYEGYVIKVNDIQKELNKYKNKESIIKKIKYHKK